MSDDTLDTRQSLADLGTLTEAGVLSTANDGVSPAPLREQKIDAHGRDYGRLTHMNRLHAFTEAQKAKILAEAAAN